MSCRAGCEVVESQDHLINCIKIHGDGQTNIDTSLLRRAGDVMDRESVQLLVERLRGESAVEQWTEATVADVL